MADRTYYISELALGMLAKTHSESVYIPESDIFSKTTTADWHKELFSLASKGVVKLSKENDCFEICGEFIPSLKNIFTSKILVSVVNCTTNRSCIYYTTPTEITEVSRSSNRKGYGITLFKTQELVSGIQELLNLPKGYNNGTIETDEFINSIEKCLDIEEPAFSPKCLTMSIDEIKTFVDGAVGLLDVFSCKEEKVVSRIVIYQRSIYYKIAEISSDGVSIISYNGVNFNDAINDVIGEKL